MRVIPIESVREGTSLGKTIFDDDGRILLREGVMLTETYLRRIKGLQIQSIYVRDEYSDVEIEDVIKPELRLKAVKMIKDTFQLLSKQTLPDVAKKRDDCFRNMGDIAHQIMEELLYKKNVLINMVDIKSMDNYTYQHSVNVAILSLIIGIEMNLSKKDLYDLCLGALLHDVGKVMVPKELIVKTTELTPKEVEIVKKHTTLGYDYLKGNIDIPPASRIITLYHHERFDGKGYPDAREGDEINFLARIVSVADVFDALTSDRSYRKAISPNDALEYIMAGSSTQFDFSVVKSFSKVVVPYPNGTIVVLNNGEIALALETFMNYPLRPMLKIIKSSDPKRIGKIISLVDELNMVIVRLEYNV